MQFRNIMISSAKDIIIKNNQLVIDKEEQVSFPLEDINAIIIENGYAKLSAYALRQIADSGIVLYICDETHTPSAVMLPIVKHSRHFRMLKNQIESSKPNNKQLWQSIVVRKIQNQAKCLEILHIDGYNELRAMSREVRSGDTTHVEAKAAAFYFVRLCGSDFTRGDESVINAMLNYGYAIIRGMIARTIVAYGFEPSIGIWHQSELNSFNLADDFIEPFRPFVDLYVVALMDIDKEEIEPMDKRMLVHMLDYDMLLNKEHRVIKNCIDLLVASYSSALQNRDTKLLLPELEDLRVHRYE